MSAADVILIIAVLWSGVVLIAAPLLIAFVRWCDQPPKYPPLPSGSIDRDRQCQ